MGDLIERLNEDWGLLNMFREETGTEALNRPMNDIEEAMAEIERLRTALAATQTHK